MRRWMLAVAVLVAGVTWAAPRECKKACEQTVKECQQQCKPVMEKAGKKGLIGFCQDQCKEFQKECEKDCADEAAKGKKR